MRESGASESEAGGPPEGGGSYEGMPAEGEQRFRMIFEAGPLGIALVGLDHRLFEVNARLCQMLGYSRQDLMGAAFPDITYPEDIEKDRNLADRLFRGEIPCYSIEKRYIGKNGGLVWGRLTATVIRSKAGEPLYGLAMVEDVTDRHHAEHMFEALLERDADGVALVVGGKIARFNSRFAAMMGRPPEDLLGLSPTELPVPEEREHVAERVRAVIEGGPEFPSEYHVQRPDGSILPVEVMSQLVEVDRGPALLSVVRDLTEREEALRRLKESEERFRKLAETASAAIIIFRDGRVLYMNPAAEALTGLTPEEATGTQQPWQFIHPDDRDGLQDRIARREAGESVSSPYQFRIIRRNGEERWVESTATLIDFEGEPAGLSYVIDITDRMRAQEELRRSRDELEGRVERQAVGKNPYGLTFRELVVLNLIASGKADKEIAAQLGISPLTAQKHASNIFTKMDAASRTEAGVRAVREGLVE